jgi:hypothetical protein
MSGSPPTATEEPTFQFGGFVPTTEFTSELHHLVVAAKQH